MCAVIAVVSGSYHLQAVYVDHVAGESFYFVLFYLVSGFQPIHLLWGSLAPSYHAWGTGCGILDHKHVLSCDESQAFRFLLAAACLWVIFAFCPTHEETKYGHFV